MPVTLHQPVAGMDRGQTYTGPLEPWLLVNGYASRTDDNVDKANSLTGVDSPAQDPQLAANREKPLDASAEALVPGRPAVDRSLVRGGLADGLEPEVPAVETGERAAETLPPPRNLTIGGKADPAVEALHKERFDQSKAGVEVEDAVVPAPPGRRNLTVGADADSSKAQANAVLAADPNAAEETKPKVRRTAANKPIKKTDRALTEPGRSQPGEQHGVQGALTDK